MIAVWLVGPPRSVTSATHDRRVQAGGVGGGEVLGHQHRGALGRRHAGLGLADEVRDHPALDVAQVGHPLGHQAAHAGEDRDELLDAGVHRASRSSPERRCLRTAPRRPLSRARPGARGEHLGGGARGGVGLALEAVGDGADRARRTPRAPPPRPGRPPSKAAIASGETSVADDQGGAVGDAGHHRGAVQEGGLVRVGGGAVRGVGAGDHGHKLTPSNP